MDINLLTKLHSLSNIDKPEFIYKNIDVFKNYTVMYVDRDRGKSLNGLEIISKKLGMELHTIFSHTNILTYNSKVFEEQLYAEFINKNHRIMIYHEILLSLDTQVASYLAKFYQDKDYLKRIKQDKIEGLSKNWGDLPMLLDYNPYLYENISKIKDKKIKKKDYIYKNVYIMQKIFPTKNLSKLRLSFANNIFSHIRTRKILKMFDSQSGKIALNRIEHTYQLSYICLLATVYINYNYKKLSSE